MMTLNGKPAIEPTYLIRPVPGGHEVAKFEGGKDPEVVYFVEEHDCSCPARVFPCKHVGMVEDYKREGNEFGDIFLDHGLYAKLEEWRKSHVSQ